MRICIFNGRIIEAQSNATEGTLLANAESAGLIGAEEQEVTELEYEAALLLQPRTPAEQNSAITAQIAALDQKRIRPLAELVGKPYDPTSGDAFYLAQLNEQIVALRAQLK